MTQPTPTTPRCIACRAPAESPEDIDSALRREPCTRCKLDHRDLRVPSREDALPDGTGWT